MLPQDFTRLAHVRFELSTLVRLRQAAAEDGCSLAAVIRRFVLDGLRRREATMIADE